VSSDSGRVLKPPWGHSRCFSKNGLAGGVLQMTRPEIDVLQLAKRTCEDA